MKWTINPVPKKRTHHTHYLVIAFIDNVKKALTSLLNPIDSHRIFLFFFWWTTRSPSFLFGSKAEAPLVLIITYRSLIGIVIRLRLRSGTLVPKRTKFSLRFTVQRIDPCSFPSTCYLRHWSPWNCVNPVSTAFWNNSKKRCSLVQRDFKW